MAIKFPKPYTYDAARDEYKAKKAEGTHPGGIVPVTSGVLRELATTTAASLDYTSGTAIRCVPEPFVVDDVPDVSEPLERIVGRLAAEYGWGALKKSIDHFSEVFTLSDDGDDYPSKLDAMIDEYNVGRELDG